MFSAYLSICHAASGVGGEGVATSTRRSGPTSALGRFARRVLDVLGPHPGTAPR